MLGREPKRERRALRSLGRFRGDSAPLASSYFPFRFNASALRICVPDTSALAMSHFFEFGSGEFRRRASEERRPRLGALSCRPPLALIAGRVQRPLCNAANVSAVSNRITDVVAVHTEGKPHGVGRAHPHVDARDWHFLIDGGAVARGRTAYRCRTFVTGEYGRVRYGFVEQSCARRYSSVARKVVRVCAASGSIGVLGPAPLGRCPGLRST